MSILFSRQCEYALQAVLYLASKGQGETTSIRELTKMLEIPYHFIAKIFQDLTHKGLLVSLKGRSGGFALAMPAKDITLFHVVEAIDGVGFLNNCLLGFPECSGKNPCAVHERWATLRDSLYAVLSSKNIEEMANATQKPHFHPGRK